MIRTQSVTTKEKDNNLIPWAILLRIVPNIRWTVEIREQTQSIENLRHQTERREFYSPLYPKEELNKTS